MKVLKKPFRKASGLRISSRFGLRSDKSPALFFEGGQNFPSGKYLLDVPLLCLLIYSNNQRLPSSAVSSCKYLLFMVWYWFSPLIFPRSSKVNPNCSGRFFWTCKLRQKSQITRPFFFRALLFYELGSFSGIFFHWTSTVFKALT